MVTSDEVKKNLTHGDAWLRVFFIVVFAFVYWVVNWVLVAVVLVQVCWSLITSNTIGTSAGSISKLIITTMQRK